VDGARRIAGLRGEALWFVLGENISPASAAALRASRF
jgi:hypothetical protein